MNKSILILIFGITIGTSIYGQCAKKTIKDDMTGNVINYVASGEIKVKEGAQIISMYLKETIVKASGDTIYTLEVNTKWLHKPVVVGEKANMIIKLSNDSLVTLNSIASSSAKRIAGGNYWEITSNYLISKQQISVLASGNLMKLRIYTVSEFLEFNVKEKFIPLLPEMAKCFLAK